MQSLSLLAFANYNTADKTTNYERFEEGWGAVVTSNVYEMRTNKGGTGTARSWRIYFGGTTSVAVDVGTAVDAGLKLSTSSSSSALTTGRVISGGTVTATSGTSVGTKVAETFAPTATSTMAGIALLVAPTVNYSAGTPGAGSYEALRISATETALPTGTNYLIRALAGSAGTTEKFAVKNTGTVVSTLGTVTDAAVAVFDGSVTWNGGVTPYVGIKLNVTNGGSIPGASKSIDMQYGGSSKFSVDASDGDVTCGAVNATGNMTVSGDANFVSNNVILRSVSGLGEVACDRLFLMNGTATLTAVLLGSKVWDPASLTAGTGTSTTVTVAGAELGDFAIASFTQDLQTQQLLAAVTATDTVTVRLQNVTAATRDLASGTLAVLVFKAS